MNALFSQAVQNNLAKQDFSQQTLKEKPLLGILEVLFCFVNNTIVLKAEGYSDLQSCFGHAPSKDSVFGFLLEKFIPLNFSKEVKLNSPLPSQFTIQCGLLGIL